MRRESRIALLLAVPLLFAAAATGLWVEGARRAAGIVPSPARIPLGGFEPLVLDLLWLRAETCLREGRYPEAVATIRVTTELQPRIPENWTVLGHLLAWRTSESSGDPEVQWRWAREGIGVIERGIRHNPDDAGLLRELGTLYLHRVAARREVALASEGDLGEPPAARARRAFLRLAGLTGDPDYLLNYAVASRMLGERLAEAGRTAAALEVLRETRGRLAGAARTGSDEELPRRIEEIERAIEALEGR